MRHSFIHRGLFVLLLLATAGAGAGGQVWAQCVPTRVLLRAGTDARFALDSLDAYLPAGEWARHQPPPGMSADVYWTHAGAGTQPGTGTLLLDDAQLSLRRPSSGSTNQAGEASSATAVVRDVLFKTRQRGCFTAVRAELRRAGLAAEPVSCVGCEGERFVGPRYTVTLFDQRAGYDKGTSPYPYVISVRLTMAPSPAAARTPARE